MILVYYFADRNARFFRVLIVASIKEKIHNIPICTPYNGSPICAQHERVSRYMLFIVG